MYYLLMILVPSNKVEKIKYFSTLLGLIFIEITRGPCPKFHIFTKNRNFLKNDCNFLDQLLLPYKFYGRDMKVIYFFIYASCEP